MPSLRVRLVHGALWSTLENGINHALNLLIFLILARLLTSVEYGIVGMAMVAVAFAKILVSEDLADGLIQIATLRRQHLDTMFSMALLVSCVLAAGLLFLANSIADFYKQASVASFVVVLASVPILDALSVVPKALVRREMKFRVFAIRGLIATSISGAVGISAALWGAGAWSLVAAQVSRSLAEVLVLWTASNFRPRVAIERAALIELFPFTARIAAARLLLFIEQQLPRVALGVMLGPAALGVFIFASSIVLMVMSSLILPFVRVIAPAVARMQTDTARIQLLLKSSFQLSTAAIFPAFMGLSLVAPLLIGTVISEKWVAGIELIQLFALSNLFAGEVLFSVVLRGLGQVKSLVVVRIVSVLLTFIASSTILTGDVVLVTLAICIKNVISYQMPAFILYKTPGFRLGALATKSLGPFIAATLMALCVWLWIHFMSAELSGWTVLVSSILIGVLLYPLFLLVFGRSVFMDAVALRGMVSS